VAPNQPAVAAHICRHQTVLLFTPCSSPTRHCLLHDLLHRTPAVTYFTPLMSYSCMHRTVTGAGDRAGQLGSGATVGCKASQQETHANQWVNRGERRGAAFFAPAFRRASSAVLAARIVVNRCLGLKHSHAEASGAGGMGGWGTSRGGGAHGDRRRRQAGPQTTSKGT
jgi:hypothetical protein